MNLMKVIFILIFMSLNAHADLSIQKDNVKKTIDYVTLNELSQEAEDVWSRRDLNEMIHFKETVNQYLESSIVNISAFVEAVDGNWSAEVFGHQEASVSGSLHPYLVHTLFDIVIPDLRKYEKRKSDSAQNQSWSKKAVFIYFILIAEHAKPCTADLTTMDYLSAVWSLQTYIDKILPNRFLSGVLNGDECSKKVYYEHSNVFYGDRMHNHADATFGNLKALLERK